MRVPPLPPALCTPARRPGADPGPRRLPQNYPDGEIAEMVQLFVQRGMDRYDADDVIRTMAKYKVRAARARRAARVSEARGGKCRAHPSQEFFVNLMMTEELSLPLPSHVQFSVRQSAIMCATPRTERRAAPRTEPRRLAGSRRSSLSASRRCSSSPSGSALA